MFGCTPTFFEERLKVFSKAVEEGKPEGFWGGVVGEVVEEVAKGGVEEGRGKAVVLWFVSGLYSLTIERVERKGLTNFAHRGGIVRRHI